MFWLILLFRNSVSDCIAQLLIFYQDLQITATSQPTNILDNLQPIENSNKSKGAAGGQACLHFSSTFWGNTAAHLDIMPSRWCPSVISNSPLGTRTELYNTVNCRNMTHTLRVCLSCYFALTVIVPVLGTKQNEFPFISPQPPAELRWQANELKHQHANTHKWKYLMLHTYIYKRLKKINK